MSGGDEAAIRAKLEALRESLEASLSKGSEATQPVQLDQPIGRVSRIDAIQQQQMAKAARRGHQLRLQQVKAALDALAAGEYGFCRGCEEEIAPARLAARPETPFCLDCQRRRER